MLVVVSALAASVVLGSIPSGILVAKAMGLEDPRAKGSGNIGAANMTRVGGKKAGAITLVMDFLKGLLPVFLLTRSEAWGGLVIPCALLLVLGHCYSVFLRGRGGKGVATGAGALFGIHPLVGATALLVWLVVFIPSRISSLSALVAVWSAPIALWVLRFDSWAILATTTMALIIVRRHHDNLRALLENSERSF